MNVFNRIENLVNTQRSPPVSPEERAFVRQFGAGTRKIKYSGRSDLVGVVVVGSKTGFRIEQATSGRKVRLLEVVNGCIFPTLSTVSLRFRDNTLILKGKQVWVS